MKAGAMIESKFLKKEDLNYDTGNLVTVFKIDRQNVGLADGEEELKWCMRFEEFDKPMVLNSTNIQLATKALGTDETDDWIGQRLVIYVDDNVSFGGKLVGGIRIRKPRGQAQRQAPQQSRREPQPQPAQQRTAATRDVIGPSGRTFEQEMNDGPAPW